MTFAIIPAVANTSMNSEFLQQYAIVMAQGGLRVHTPAAG